MRPVRRLGVLAGFLCLITVWAASAPPAAAIEVVARQAILMDMTTGAVLFEKNADEAAPTASPGAARAGGRKVKREP